ncbi:MAG: hypothetical protein FJ276_02895 [Planctomycetes bacterium]|nr:hypothetical protein [Planctomycetota bacterium]
MFTCRPGRACHGCCHAVSRREFLGATAAVAATALLPRDASAAARNQPKTRVAAVFLANINVHEIWPYPGFDTQGRQAEVLAVLNQGCPDVEFVPVTLTQPADVPKAVAMKDEVDGYLIHAMTLDWAQTQWLIQIASLGKPTLVADEYLGGSGVFLVGVASLMSRGVPVAVVSSTRLEDLALVARQFADVRQPGATPAAFVRKCEEAYRGTFPASHAAACSDDAITLTDIGECVRRFRESRFLIVGAGQPGQEHDFLGAKGRFLGFDELQAFYAEADREEAREWAGRWLKEAEELKPGEYVEPSRPIAEAVENAGAVYLATLKLLAKHGTDTVTMNCLGGFAAGKLAAYPCLGFMQLMNDGGQGVCEAMPDDTLSMLMARILTGRPGFVSDPAIDTSKNQIVYAHCVGATRVFGPRGAVNGYRIRTLHNRDPRGACAESFMPGGFMTTTFRTNVQRKELLVHQAKAVGPLDSERGCRTKLLAEVRGDIGKMFDQWDQFSWHRVTVYGDVKEPLAEFGKALGLKVIEEA